MKFTATTESPAPCQHTLRVEVAAESVTDEFKRAVSEIQKIAQIPGFRPGKVPLAIVEKKFAKQIEGEIQKTLIPQSYQAAIDEKKLRPIAYPKIEGIEFAVNQPLRYTATVETAPEFTLPQYKNLSVKTLDVTVSDEDIENALRVLQDQNANFEDVTDRVLAKGDFAQITHQGVCNGKPIGELVPNAKNLGSAQKFWLVIDDKSFLPTFCEQMVGTKLGETKQVIVIFPTDYGVKELQGQKATYTVELLAIKEKKPPTLDDVFAQSLKIPTVTELRERVRADLLRTRQAKSEEDQRTQMINALLAGTTLDLPPTLVATETRQMIYNTVRSLKMQGAPDEAIEEHKEKIFGSATQGANDRVKGRLILTRIAEAENLKVTREELEHEIAHLASHEGISVKQLREQLDERGALGALAEDLVVNKALDFLLQHAKVEPSKP